MKIQYNPSQSGGKLQVYGTTEAEARDLTNMIWNFVYSHRNFVLRKFHDECKVACVYQIHNNFKQEDGSFVILGLFSSWESHKPYLDILQQELQLNIENISTIETHVTYTN